MSSIGIPVQVAGALAAVSAAVLSHERTPPSKAGARARRRSAHASEDTGVRPTR